MWCLKIFPREGKRGKICVLSIATFPIDISTVDPLVNDDRQAPLEYKNQYKGFYIEMCPGTLGDLLPDPRLENSDLEHSEGHNLYCFSKG